MEDATKNKREAALKRAKTRLAAFDERVKKEQALSAAEKLFVPTPDSINRQKFVKAKQDKKKKNMDRQAELRELASQTPFSVEVQVVEVKDGNAFLAAIADILDGTKEDIASAIKARVDPTTRAEAAEQAADDKHTQDKGVLKAIQDVEVAELELTLIDSATRAADHLKKVHEIERLKLTANEVLRKAGLPAKYTVSVP